MKPKQAIRWALVFAAILIFFIWLRSWGTTPQDLIIEDTSTQAMELIPPPLGSEFDRYYQAIESGGVTQDGIPSIDAPDFIPLQNSKVFMQDND